MNRSSVSRSSNQKYIGTLEGNTSNTAFDQYKADLSKAELVEMISKEKDEKMINYLNNQLMQYESDEGIYQNQAFLINICKYQNPEEISAVYKENYNIITVHFLNLPFYYHSFFK